MKTTKELVRTYNTLAISLPDKVWTARFDHPRMELVANRVYLEYNIRQAGQLIPRREPVLVEDLPTELLRLKRRAYERG